jgi:hypothetical protein
MVYLSSNVYHICYIGLERHETHSNKSYQACSTGKDHCIGFPSTSTPKLLFAVDEMGSRKDQTTVRIQ